jgi:hypothetical protein
MKREWQWSNISWRTKKHTAEVLCVLVVVSALVLTLLVQEPKQVSGQDEVRMSGGYRMDNNGTYVNLSLSSTQVKQDETGDVEKEKTTEESSGNAKNTNTSVNKVVGNEEASGEGETAKNTVVKNPSPMTLVSTIFENHGQLRELEADKIMYQYPVELGYAVDKNFDGMQTEKDSILNMVMDTVPETEDEEVAEVDATEEDNASEDDVTKSEESTSESDEDTSDSEKELSQREKFQNEIWSQLMVTEPVEIEKEEQLKVEETVTKDESDKGGDASQPSSSEKKTSIQDTEGQSDTELEEESRETSTETDVDSSEESTENSTEETKEKNANETTSVVTANAGYYIISGKMREGQNVFVSDIMIKPSGVDGFNQVRIGEDGEFKNSVLITQDALNKEVDLYFTDGQRVTEKTTFVYTKDTVSPVIEADEEDVKILASESEQIFCTNNSEVALKIQDGEAQTSSGIEKLMCVYGDKIAYVFDNLQQPKVILPEDFYGRVLSSCEDKAGNHSDIISQYYLVDSTAPEIQISDSELCTAPYTLWVDVADSGHIISGIDNVECLINGTPYDIEEFVNREDVQLADDLEVPSSMEFSIPFEQEGEYTVEIRVTDNAGNVTTTEKTIDVTQPDLVAVYMPKEFTIHIDPQQLLGKEQIFSDDITLENVSNVDVAVQIEEIQVTVNDEVSDTGVVKDCDLYLVAPDTGEKIELKKGSNKNVYTYCLPVEAQGDITSLYFVGDTTEGSDAMWRSSDISINVKLSFGKWSEK